MRYGHCGPGWIKNMDEHEFQPPLGHWPLTADQSAVRGCRGSRHVIQYCFHDGVSAPKRDFLMQISLWSAFGHFHICSSSGSDLPLREWLGFWRVFSLMCQLFQIAEMALVKYSILPWCDSNWAGQRKTEGAPASGEDDCVVKIRI